VDCHRSRQRHEKHRAPRQAQPPCIPQARPKDRYALVQGAGAKRRPGCCQCKSNKLEICRHRGMNRRRSGFRVRWQCQLAAGRLSISSAHPLWRGGPCSGQTSAHALLIPRGTSTSTLLRWHRVTLTASVQSGMDRRAVGCAPSLMVPL
jgi:hypothetical protein